MSSAFAMSTYDNLVELRLIAPGDKPSLHLGCGENHISGYINIDFPLSNRPLHTALSADYYHDISKLRFPNNSVSHIENHHVFEHFSRPTSLALLCAWFDWLSVGGTLKIETPDFDAGILRYSKSQSFQEKQIVIRHLFGSHEENWAVHWDGWYREKFIHILKSIGFNIKSVQPFSWQSLDNIEVIAIKEKEIHINELREKAMELLKLSMVDNSDSEIKMWEKWCHDFNEAFTLMLN